MSAPSPRMIPRISPEALNALFDERQAVAVVDVREPADYTSSPLTILGAIQFPPDDVSRRYHEIPRHVPVVVFGADAQETASLRVAQFLSEHGYSDISLLVGGFDAWESLGYPTEDKSGLDYSPPS